MSPDASPAGTPPPASAITRSPVRLAALLALLAMFGPFTIDAFFPAFHAVQHDLNASAFQMQQTISVYLVAYALMSLFHGPLSDSYGRRRVILIGVVCFTLASVGCALSHSIEMLLFFRMLQGFSTGAGLIVSRAMVRDLYQGADAQRTMSLITLFFSVAPALAPVIGGVVFTAAGWAAVFWFLALYGAGLCWLCVRVLPETHPPASRVEFSAAELWRTYSTIIVDGRFLLLAVCTGFNFGAFFLYISSAPAFVETLLGLGSLGFPWFFVPCIAGMMTGAALSNRLAGKMPPRRTTRLGYTLMAVAVTLNLTYNLLVTNPTVPWVVLPVALNSVGVSLAFPVLSIKMLDRYPQHRGAASSVQGFVWGLMTGAIAGVLSQHIATSTLNLAVGAGTMTFLGFLCWRWYVHLTPQAPATPIDPVELEEQVESV